MDSLGLEVLLDGANVLELGPGHYGFALLARALGARVTCFEKDGAFAKLGAHLGFRMWEGDFYSELGKGKYEEVFDGVWVKGTFNACHLKKSSRIMDFAKRLDACLRPGGWGLLVPVNKMGPDSGSQLVQECVRSQHDIMVALGWRAVELPESLRRAMAFHYSGSPFIYLKNLEFATEETREGWGFE